MTTAPSAIRSQFAAIMASRLASAALQALVGIGLARALLPADYGRITSFAGVVLFWFIVCDLGIASYTPRARALGHAAAVSTAMFVNWTTATLGAVVAITLTLLGPFEPVLVVRPRAHRGGSGSGQERGGCPRHHDRRR